MKKIISSKWFLLFNIFLMLFVIPTIQSIKAASYDISLEPSFLRVYVQPVKTFQSTFAVKNDGDPGQYFFSIKQLDLNGDGEELRFKKTNTSDPLVKIETIQGAGGRILWEAGGEKIEVPSLFVNSPEELKVDISVVSSSEGVLGEYHFALLVSKVPPNAISNSTINISLEPAVAALIFVGVTDGAVGIEGGIESFVIPKSITINLFGTPISFIDNSSFVHTIPVQLRAYNKEKYTTLVQGKVIVNGLLGEKITYEVQPTYVLPFTTRLLRVNQTAMCSANSKCVHEEDVTLILKGVPFGYFRLTSEVTFGAQAQKAYKSINYLVLPFWLIGILGGGVLGVYSLIIKRKSA